VKRINVLASFDLSIEEVKNELAVADRPRAGEFALAAGAAFERVCENPGIGRPMGGVMFSHKLHGFPFAVIYEVTEAELCFIYLASV
jgi:hypothetical protein